MDRYKEEAVRLWDEVVVDSRGYQFVDMWSSRFLSGAVYFGSVFGAAVQRSQHASRESCPGYAVSNVETTATGLTASLTLAGPACNVFGNDVEELRLLVNYDAGISPFLFVERCALTRIQNLGFMSRLRMLERLHIKSQSVSSQHQTTATQSQQRNPP